MSKQRTVYDEEYDEVYYDETPEKSEQDEWFEDDCRERARDMQEELTRLNHPLLH